MPPWPRETTGPGAKPLTLIIGDVSLTVNETLAPCRYTAGSAR